MGRRTSGPALAALRERLAQTAARLMIEGGIEDYGLAKRKAAERLGVRNLGALPSNAQIAASVAERQRIFEPDTQRRRVQGLRRIALGIMDLLAPFEPRLVGPVLAGTATPASPIELHAFADSPESVAALLVDHGVALRDCQRRYRFSARRVSLVPGYRFVQDGADVVVVTFPENGLREAPLSPVDQRPMRRAGRNEVAELVPDAN
ncbi:MAG TPA: hypothetical protein VF329_09345 [Gammaproteobacteria bacterium]